MPIVESSMEVRVQPENVPRTRMIFIVKKQQFDSVTILGEHAEIDSLGRDGGPQWKTFTRQDFGCVGHEFL